MNKITIGLSKPRSWVYATTEPEIFIEVPIDRKICVSHYLLHVTWLGTTIRLADKFYKENRVIFSKALAISHQKEIELIDWGKTKTTQHTIGTVGRAVFDRILGFQKTEKNKQLNTQNSYNVIKILHSIGEEKVKYSWLNYFKN